MTTKNFIDDTTLKTLESIEKDFFDKSALDALKRYESEFQNCDEITKNYIEVVKARQNQRLGMYKEAHIIITNLQ